jgi:hypothetical protein
MKSVLQRDRSDTFEGHGGEQSDRKSRHEDPETMLKSFGTDRKSFGSQRERFGTDLSGKEYHG